MPDRHLAEQDPARVGEQQNCPEVQAGLLSKIFSFWMGDILKKGYQRPLERSDMYRLGEQYLTKTVSRQLDAAWTTRKAVEQEWPLLWSISDAFGGPFYVAGLLKLFGDVAAMTTPFALKCLISTIQSSMAVNNTSVALIREGYVYCFIIFGLQVMNTVAVNSYFSINFRVGMKTRTALNALVYAKSQRLSAAARQEFSNGQIVNLISGDSGRVEMATLFLHYIWSGPFQLIIILSIMFAMIGPVVFIGLLMFLISIPIQSKLTTWLSKYRKVRYKSNEMLYL